MKNLFTSMLCVLAWAACAAHAQRLDRAVVILSTPENDSEVAEKVIAPSSAVASLEELRVLFPDDEYLLLDEDEGWYFLIDRDHRSLRAHLGREDVLRAFLSVADERGFLLWGELDEEVKESALEQLVSGAHAIRAMGRGADNVKIHLSLSLTMEVSDGKRRIKREFIPRPSLSNQPVAAASFSGHEVIALEFTPEIESALRRNSLNEQRDKYGLSARYLNVHPHRTNSATIKALEAFNDYLREHIRSMDSVYEKLEERFVTSRIPELGGRIPRIPLSREQVPKSLWSAFLGMIRSGEGVEGGWDDADVERFIADVREVNLRINYDLSYSVIRPRRPDGTPSTSWGVSIRLIER